MIAVLVDSRRKGASRWIAVRHSREVVLSGLRLEDVIELYGKNGDTAYAIQVEACEGTQVIALEEETKFVKACHVQAGPDSGVYVDLR